MKNIKIKIIIAVLLIFFSPAHMIYGGENYDSRLLWLINAQNRLDGGWVPEGLVKHDGFLMRGELVEPFERMIAAMSADGIAPPQIQSAYRDYRHQQHLFAQKKNFYKQQGCNSDDAEAYASRTVAFPGASEHQSGLAVDVTTDGMLRQTFGETEQGKWLNIHSHEFGFSVRYPTDKTNVTGIIYEPWHLRYVGMPHASLMKEKNLCLEEYIEYLAVNERVIFWNEDGSYYLIGCANQPVVELPCPYAFSSDKQNGGKRFITTLLKT